MTPVLMHMMISGTRSFMAARISPTALRSQVGRCPLPFAGFLKWQWTMVAPALNACAACSAISSGVTGTWCTAGSVRTPVNAQVMTVFDSIFASFLDVAVSLPAELCPLECSFPFLHMCGYGLEFPFLHMCGYGLEEIFRGEDHGGPGGIVPKGGVQHQVVVEEHDILGPLHGKRRIAGYFLCDLTGLRRKGLFPLRSYGTPQKGFPCPGTRDLQD